MPDALSLASLAVQEWVHDPSKANQSQNPLTGIFLMGFSGGKSLYLFDHEVTGYVLVAALTKK